MVEEIVFRSIEDFEKHYFPRFYEERNLNEMTSEEQGRYLARKSLKEIWS